VSWHRDLSSADVNLLRFGFAGAVCTVAVALREAALDQFAAQTRARSDASAAAYATAIAAAPKEGEVVVRESHGIPPPESGAAATGRIDSNGVAETTSNEAAVCATSRAGGSSGSSSDDAVAVAEARAAVAMTGADWRAVGVGVVFVTVLCPLASTWCLFHLPLAVALTLGSTAPLWSLPVARCHGEDLTQRAVGGALLATAGVVMLAFN
jgi:drug/metabolite transporter (DMT)-like permease